MTSRQSIAVGVVFGLLGFVLIAWADSRGPRKRAHRAVFDDKCQGQILTGSLNAKVQEASTTLESGLARMTNAKAAAVFKVLWDQFKTTRDNQIIPAINKCDADEPKKIADARRSAERTGM